MTAWVLRVVAFVCLIPAQTFAANYIQTENAKPGSTEWKLANPGYASSVIEGYASLTSVNRGGRILLFVNTQESTYKMDIFRMGYYGGAGGRRMMNTISRSGTAQPACPMDATTGLIECDWVDPYVLDIPNTPDPTDWMSGVYLVKLTAGTSGKQQYIMFAVRDDARFSDLLMAQTVNTSQSYNVWGGKSLYGTIASRGDTANAAHKVSFNRPYYGDDSYGVGSFSWEQNMLTWLEREGYDVSYATNVDVDADSNLLLNHKAFLSVGHDEYWTWAMRDNVERARDSGINLGFFSGNTSYWQVRYEPSTVNNQPARTIVGYKEAWKQDPITPDYLKTNEFRYAPVNRPEDTMIGVMFVTQARPVMVIEDASSWVFTGTGLQNGDRLTKADGTSFLGYEVDAMGPTSPANVQRLAHSPANSREANFSDMTVYRAPSGATVFATGSIGWSQVVPQIQQITRNVLARFINNAFSDTVPVRPSPPAPFAVKDIGDVGRPGFVALAGPDSVTLNGAGQNDFLGQDALYYMYQPLSGDGEITARLNALQLYWDNRAGVMIRESLSGTAKYVSLIGRPSESSGSLLEGVDFKIKDVVCAKPRKVAGHDQKLPNWLKLTRTGDNFTAQVSADGVNWTVVGTANVPMASTVYIGLSVASARHGVWATARFDNIAVTAGSGGPGGQPPVVSVTSPTNGSAVSGTVTLSANASDDVAVAGVQFQVDGVNVGAEDTTAPYSVTWDSRLVSNTTHTVKAIARDTSNNVASATVSVTVNNPASLPSGWAHADIGAVGSAGNASFNNSTFSVTGAGADTWGSADAFHYAYATLSGDGRIVARVATIQNIAPWTKAGVMVRASLDPGSAHGFMLASAGKGLAFQRRTATDGVSVSTAGGAFNAPRWVRLDRAGSTLSAYQSADGATWTLVGTDTISMPIQVYVGLAVSSHVAGTNATATFDNVTITGGGGLGQPPVVSVTSPANGSTVSGTVTLSANASDDVGVAGVQFQVDGANVGAEDTSAPYSVTWDSRLAGNGPHTVKAIARDTSNQVANATVSVTVSNTASLPSGWAHADIGAVGSTGNASFTTATSTFSVAGAGADTWGTADAFHYAYATLSGDGRIVARVATIQNVAPWTKAGVMVRASLDPGSAHAFMLASAGKGLAFQRRTATDGVSVSTAGGAFNAPRWVRLDRDGSTLSAYQSADGATWTLVGTDTISMPTQVYVGLAVSSHVAGTNATATFDNVTITSATPPSTCSVTLDSESTIIGAGTPGTATSATWYINVTSGACTWTAKSDTAWLEVKDPSTAVYVHQTDVSFTGSNAVKVHALTNSGPKREGHFLINGVVYTVTQGGGS